MRWKLSFHHHGFFSLSPEFNVGIVSPLRLHTGGRSDGNSIAIIAAFSWCPECRMVIHGLGGVQSGAPPRLQTGGRSGFCQRGPRPEWEEVVSVPLVGEVADRSLQASPIGSCYIHNQRRAEGVIPRGPILERLGSKRVVVVGHTKTSFTAEDSSARIR